MSGFLPCSECEYPWGNKCGQRCAYDSRDTFRPNLDPNALTEAEKAALLGLARTPLERRALRKLFAIIES